MVKIEVGRRLFVLIISVVIVAGLAVFGYAYGSSQPQLNGHTADEIEGLPGNLKDMLECGPGKVPYTDDSSDWGCADPSDLIVTFDYDWFPANGPTVDHPRWVPDTTICKTTCEALPLPGINVTDNEGYICKDENGQRQTTIATTPVYGSDTDYHIGCGTLWLKQCYCKVPKP